MFTLFIVLHVIFCVFLILVILLQTGKGAGIGAAFGGGSQTVFGPRGAGSFIGKLTGIVAGLFMFTSMVLAFQSTSKSGTIEERVSALQTESAKSVEEVDIAADNKEMVQENESSEKAVAADAGAAQADDKNSDSATPEATADKEGSESEKPATTADDNTPQELKKKAVDVEKPAGLKTSEKAKKPAKLEKTEPSTKAVKKKKAEESKPVEAIKKETAAKATAQPDGADEKAKAKKVANPKDVSKAADKEATAVE